MAGVRETVPKTLRIFIKFTVVYFILCLFVNDDDNVIKRPF